MRFQFCVTTIPKSQIELNRTTRLQNMDTGSGTKKQGLRYLKFAASFVVGVALIAFVVLKKESATTNEADNILDRNPDADLLEQSNGGITHVVQIGEVLLDAGDAEDDEDKVFLDLTILGEDFEFESFEDLEAIIEEDPGRFSLDFDEQALFESLDIHRPPSRPEFRSGAVNIPRYPHTPAAVPGGPDETSSGLDESSGGPHEAFRERSDTPNERRIRLLNYNTNKCGSTPNTCNVLAWLDGVSDATDDVLSEGYCILEFVEKLYKIDKQNDKFNDYLKYQKKQLPIAKTGLTACSILPTVGSACGTGKSAVGGILEVVKLTKIVSDGVKIMLSPIEPLRNLMNDVLANVTSYNVQVDMAETVIDMLRQLIVNDCPNAKSTLEASSADILQVLPTVEPIIQSIADDVLAPVCAALIDIDGTGIIDLFLDMLKGVNLVIDPIDFSMRLVIEPVLFEFDKLLSKKFCALGVCKSLKNIIKYYELLYEMIKAKIINLVKKILDMFDINKGFMKLNWFDLDGLDFTAPTLGNLDFGLNPQFPGWTDIDLPNPCTD